MHFRTRGQRQTFRDTRTHCVVLVSWQRDSSQNTDDRNHDHQFDQGETLLNHLFHENSLERASVLTCVGKCICRASQKRRQNDVFQGLLALIVQIFVTSSINTLTKIGSCRVLDAPAPGSLIILFRKPFQRFYRLKYLLHYLTQTARTCFRSVTPISTLCMPSIFRVCMPASTQAVNNCATRARA